MIEATNIYADRRIPIRRNDSFSTASIASAADVAQQNKNINRRVQESAIFMANNTTNVKFHNSESIHVGNIVYHIHYHSSRKNDDRDADSMRSDSFGSLTIETVQTFRKLPTNEKKFKKIGFRIIVSIISIILVVISAFVASYFALWHKPKNFSTTTPEFTSSTITDNDPDTTTSAYITTTESSFKIYDYKNGTDREGWGALPPKSSNILKLKIPIRRIIIGHTGGNFCSNEDECIETVKSLQFINPELDDIAYNFLIGGDGKVYEGRGFNYQGQHTENYEATEYNSIGICIAFIGNYTSTVPSIEQFDLLKDFIETFVNNRVILYDYIVVSQDDLKYSQIRAVTLNNVIRNLQNYRPLHKIYRREEWGAQEHKGMPTLYNETVDRVVIDHSLTPECIDLTACKASARSIQTKNIESQYDDISYNLLFGGNGLVFEGRGWDIKAMDHNGVSVKLIDIGAIGNYTSAVPNQYMVGAMLEVFNDAMALGKITSDFKIFGSKDYGGSGPGDALMKIIKLWCRYGEGIKSCK